MKIRNPWLLVQSLATLLSPLNGSPSTRRGFVTGALFLSALLSSCLPGQAATTLVSDSRLTTSAQGNGTSITSFYSFNGDGTKIAFSSDATNLVSGDTNGKTDVFVRDLTTGVTTRVSVDSSGTQSNGGSSDAAISSDGTMIAFQSYASNLVENDTNATADVFVHNLVTGVTTCVSTNSSGKPGNNTSTYPSISADGTKIVFASIADDLVAGTIAQIYLRDLSAGTTTCVSRNSVGVVANNLCFDASISSDGTKVAFVTPSTNLIPNDTNNTYDVFVKTLSSGGIVRANVDNSGVPGNDECKYPRLNQDGSRVVFQSSATNLVSGDTNGSRDVFVRDLNANVTTRASVSSGGIQGNNTSYNAVISADGNRVAYYSSASNLVSNDTNGVIDVFLRDLSNATTTIMSLSTASVIGNTSSYSPSMTTDGTKIAFYSDASNLVSGDTNATYDVFIRDTAANTTTRVSVGATSTAVAPSNNSSKSTLNSLSADGTKVAFASSASNLVEGDTNGVSDIFVRDLTSGVTTRINLSNSGAQANNNSYTPYLSADGTKVVFSSDASNLVAADNNSNRDIFVRDLVAGTTKMVSRSISGAAGNNTSDFPNINSDGSKVVFCSAASNLISGDTNNAWDVFVCDMATMTTTRISVDSNGAQANSSSVSNGPSVSPSISGDGTKVAFCSSATNLVEGDTNEFVDIFVRDLTAGTTTRVSVKSDGTQANGKSDVPCLSQDGNKVAFQSQATNIGGSGYFDPIEYHIYLHDLNTHITTCVSVNSAGLRANSGAVTPSLNADGSVVAFASASTNLSSVNGNFSLSDIFVRNLNTGITTCASRRVTSSQNFEITEFPSLNAAGTQVAYPSSSSGLVISDTNGYSDVFVSDFTYNPTLSITDAVVTEGQSGTTNAVFTVTLSAAKTSVVSVGYGLSSQEFFAKDFGTPFDSDTSPNDFTLKFAPGQTTGTITVPVNGDRLVEPDEKFYVYLDSPVGAELADVVAEGTILNDDHAPVATPQSIDTPEDSGVLITLGATEATSDTLYYGFFTLPVHGVLHDGTDASAPAITSANYYLIPRGTDNYKNYKLFYVPTEDYNGTDSFRFGVDDNVNPGTFATVSFNILPVNDAPSFTKGSDQSVLDNAGAQSVAGWATALNAGPTNESGQSLDFVVSNTNNALFAVQPTVSTDGTLAYTPKIGASGSATVSVKIHDDGGIANGGVDTSAAQTFSITITKHNEAPSGITLSRSTIADNTALNTLVGNLTGTDPDAGDVLSFSLPNDISDNTAFALSGAQLRTATTFNYGAKSSYLITVRATDGGGLSFDKQFTITVTDATKPAVAISTPTLNQKIYTSNFTSGVVSGTATDNAGVASVRVRLARKRGTTNYYWNGTDFITTQSLVLADLTGAGTPNATWNLGTKVPPLNKLDAGPYSIQVSAYDAAGNKSDYADRTFTLTQDAVAPTVAIAAPTANAKVLISDFIAGAAQGTASDDIVVAAVKVRLSRKEGTTTYYWNGNDFVTASSTVDADLTGTTNATWKLLAKVPSAQQLPAGVYALAVYATDAAGNKSATATVAFSLSTDFTAPNVTINTPISNQIVNINALGAGSITGDADDNLGVASVKLKLQRSRSGVVTYWNGSAFTTTAALVDATLTPGTGTVVSWQLDQAIPASQLDKGAYTLYATAYDAAGNLKTSASRVFSVTGTASSTAAQSTPDSSASSS